MRAFSLIPVLSLCACAATSHAPNQQAAADVAGRVIGKPVDCLRSRDIESIHAVTPNVAMVTVRGHKLYRADLPGGCPALQHNPFSYRTISGRLCRGDILNVFDPVSGASYGGCTFDGFVPYQLADNTPG